MEDKKQLITTLQNECVGRSAASFFFYVKLAGICTAVSGSCLRYSSAWTPLVLFQAYLKMHEYEKAIGDCEWALKVTSGFCMR